MTDAFPVVAPFTQFNLAPWPIDTYGLPIEPAPNNAFNPLRAHPLNFTALNHAHTNLSTLVQKPYVFDNVWVNAGMSSLVARVATSDAASSARSVVLQLDTAVSKGVLCTLTQCILSESDVLSEWV